MVAGRQDSGGIFQRVNYSIGREIIDDCLDGIRKLAEECESLQGFLTFRSVGGATGSGFGDLLLERLSYNYGNKIKIDFPIYPSPNISNSVVEPYNAILSTNSLLYNSDVAVILNNEAIYDVCRRNLDYERPTYSNLNQMIA